VEVYLFYGTAVCLALCISNELVDRYGILFDFGRDSKITNDVLDVMHRRVVMVVLVFMPVMMFMIVIMVIVVIMRMIMFVRMLVCMHMLLALAHAVYPDIGVHADDTAFRGYLKIEGDTGDAQCVEFRLAGFPVARKVRERCREHVSCGAHVAFEIQSLHVVFPPM
jgi:hypothetical protein